MSATPEADTAISDGVEMLTNQSDSVALYQKLCDAVCEIQGLRRERNEALHKLELCMAANSDVARIARERDEAQKQTAKLISIAERAIDDLRWFYESKADGIILELYQLKGEAK